MVNAYAVIGMGSIAKRHFRNLKQLFPQDKIYAVSASGRNTELPENVDAIISLEQLILQKPTYVIVASPAPYHVESAKKLLANGIAVLIEKPLADRFPITDEFARYCEVKGYKNVAVGYCLRFLPSAIVVKNFIDQKNLGEIYNVTSIVGQYLPNWRTDKNYKDSVSASRDLGGGALLELSHELDYLMWFFGTVSLQHSWLRTTEELGLVVEEIVDLVLTANTGLHIAVHLDFVQKATQRKCEIIGEKGRLEWDLVANSVTLYDATGVSVIYSEPDYDKNEMYLKMLQTFSLVGHCGMQELASVQSSSRLLQLIDEAKITNSWSIP